MSFRVWYYVVKIGMPLLFASVICGILWPRGWFARIFFHPALYCLIGFALIGALLGVLALFDRLRMVCPFCGRTGQVAADPRGGMRLDCGKCGSVRGAGLLGLRLVREDRATDA